MSDKLFPIQVGRKKRFLHQINFLLLLSFLCIHCTPSANLSDPEQKSRKNSAVKRPHPERTIADYYPLKKGNRWQYLVVKRDIDTAKELSREEIEVKVLKKKERFILMQNGDTPFLFFEADNGIFRPISGKPILPKALDPGNSWRISFKGHDGKVTLVSVTAKITTPKYHFEHCLLLEEEYPERGVLIRSYYAPHVGLAHVEEMVRKDKRYQLVNSMSLVSFSLRK